MSVARRSLQVLAFICTLIVGVASMAVIVTQTTWFKEWLRGFIVRQSRDYLNGQLSIGHLGGKLGAVGFLDYGNVWADAWSFHPGDLRYAVGPGLRYQTPIGPIRLDFGYQLNPEPGLLVNGSFKQQFILQYLKDFAGLEGWCWKAKFQFRAMDVVGTTLDVWARVERKIPLANYGLVELALGLKNLEGRESTPGKGLVALPLRGGPAIPYPFVPPETDPWQGVKE